MKTLLAIAFTLTLVGAAQALPVTPLSSPSDVIQVAGGCGLGWHRGPHGRCVRDYVRPWRHPCPRGYHLGRGGHCRPNY